MARVRSTVLLSLNLPAHGELAGSFFKRHAVTRTRLPTYELRQLVGSRFQVLFHSPPGVLFTFPSRYWFTIGRQGVLSLRGWAPQIHAKFHVLRVTREHHNEDRSAFAYRAVTFCGRPFQEHSASRRFCNFATGPPSDRSGSHDPRT